MVIYKRIGITVKSGINRKSEAVQTVLKILRKHDADIRIDTDRIGDLACVNGLPAMHNMDGDIDLLIVIGGDGTILRTVREMRDFSIPILSINRGTVGFLSEIQLDEAATLLPQLLRGGGVLEERSLLHVTAHRKDGEIFSGYALNEAVIAQGTIARLVSLTTSVNDEELTSFHADGLILSSPTGSTAYSLAAGGPVVHPGIAAMILTPINPYSFSQKPLVIPGDAVVRVDVHTKQNKFRDTEVVLTLDGQVCISLQCNDSIQIRVPPQKIQFLRRKKDTFFRTLRAKLKWGERVDEE